MLEKIALCGREIETWTAGSVPPPVTATVVALAVTLAWFVPVPRVKP
jgi:hypothetical protein